MVPALPVECEDFLTWLTVERGRAKNTISAYRRDLMAYVGWLRARQTTVLTVDVTTLTVWVGEMRSGDAAPA